MKNIKFLSWLFVGVLWMLANMRMYIVGGSVENVNIGGRGFSVAGDADVTIELGGDSNSVEMNGDGTGRNIKEKIPWSMSSISVNIDPDNADLVYLQGVRDDNGFTDMEISLADGTIYSGEGTIVDEVAQSTKSATAEIKLSGPGKLEPQ